MIKKVKTQRSVSPHPSRSLVNLLVLFLSLLLGTSSVWADDISTPATCIFNESISNSDFSATKTDGSKIAYGGTTTTISGTEYSKGLKIEAKTQVTFTTTVPLKMELRYTSDDSKGAAIKVDNVARFSTDNVSIIELAAGAHVISRNGGNTVLYEIILSESMINKGWQANLQPAQLIPTDGALKINFKNIAANGNTDSYKNWLVALTTDPYTQNPDRVILRSDVCGWDNTKWYYNNDEKWTSTGYDYDNWSNFCTKMNGADVEIVISRSGNNLRMKAVATSADKSSTFTEIFTIEDAAYATDPLYARMTADFASLEPESPICIEGYYAKAFTDGNGSASPSVDFVNGSTNVTFSATPADGYLFSHWSIDGEEVSKENPFTVTVPGTDNYTLTANFIAPLHVTYNANGATGTVPVDNTDYKSGDVATIMDKGELVNATKTFYGWSTTAGNNINANVLPNSSQTITSDLNLYAQWGELTPVTTDYTWTFDNSNFGYTSLPTYNSLIKKNVHLQAGSRTITVATTGSSAKPYLHVNGGGNTTANNVHFLLGEGAYKVTVNINGIESQNITLINTTTGISETVKGNSGQLVKVFNNTASSNDLYVYSSGSGYDIISIQIEKLTYHKVYFKVNDGGSDNAGVISASVDGKLISSGDDVAVGSVVTFTTSANEWYLFNNMYYGTTSEAINTPLTPQNDIYSLTVEDNDLYVDANFKRYYRLQAVSNNNEWGIASLSFDEAGTEPITEETIIPKGTTVYFSAQPTSVAYEFVDWKCDTYGEAHTIASGSHKIENIVGPTTKALATTTATFKSKMAASDLALVSDTKSMKVGDTWTLAKGTDYTTSSDGAVTVTVVDNSGKAVTYFANAAGAKVTATAQGTAYVKISQAATANYGAAEATITVTITRDEQTVTEMTTWNLTGTDVTSSNDGEYNKLYWNAQSGTVSDNTGTYVGLKGLKLNGSQDIYFNTDGKAGTVYVTYGARKVGEYTNVKVNNEETSDNVTEATTQSFSIAQGVNKVSIKRASGNEGVVTKVVWIPTGSAYEVTTNYQSIILEQSVVGDKSYFNAEIGEDPKSKSFESQSRMLYRTKNTNQSVDFTVTGAKAVQIVATGATSKGGTQYTVSINGGAKQTITMSGTTDTSEPIVLPEGISTITIAGTGSGDLYPAKLIFYTITPSAIVVKRKNEALSISSDKLFYNEDRQTYNVTSSNTLTPITMTHTVPADVATVSFDASEGTLTITPKGGPEGSGVITFHQDGTQDGTVAEGSKALALDVIWDYYEMKYANDITIDMNTATINPFDHDIVLKPEAYNDNGVSIPAFPTLTAKKFDKDHKSGTSVTVNDDFLGSLTYTTDDNTLAKNGVDDDGRGTLTVTHGRQGLVYITATFEGDAAQHISKASASYSLTVKDGIMYSVPNATSLNAQQQIKLEDNGNLKLTLTMGGYKYGKIWNGGTKPDTWSKSNEYGGGEWVNYVDGYRYQAGGPENAGCEKVQSTGSVIGVQFYEPDTDKAEGGTYGLYERVHPFSLPVRGAYLTLSPEVNGTATVYVLQNGNLNYDTSVDEEDVLKASDPLSTSPRVYYWADQDGYIIDTKTSTGVPPVAKQPLVNGNNQTRGGNGNGGYTTISADTWTSEWNNSSWATNYQKVNGVDVLAKDYITTERTLVDGSTGIYFPNQAAVNANLANKGAATEVKPQYVIPYHGGYMVMQKCYVKYVINVLAGKTYYFFSNASKLGFAGVNFKEDPSVNKDGVTTVNGSEETLTLDQSNDNWLTGMSNYKGKQIKSVTLNRTFAANTWNTICLPFNVSEKQVQEIFGNVSISDGGISVSNNKATNPVDASKEAELVLYNGFTDSGFNTAHFLRHVDQNILAGQPYFIMPKKTVTNPTFKNVLVPEHVAMQTYGGNVGTIEWYKGTEDPFVFTGTLAGGNTLNQYDHYINVNDGKLYYMAEGASLPGFPAYRAYLKSKDNNVYKAKAINAVSFGNFESEDDNGYTTSIMQALIDEGVEIAPQRGVYNLNGQKVANSTKGLSKGIYIVNGHKISIK